MTLTPADIILAEDERNVPVVLAARSSGDPLLRTLALGSLHRLGQLADHEVLTALADTDRNVRVRAIELAIEHDGISLVPLLAEADDLVVETAAWALGERMDDGEEVVAALALVAVEHEISICREAAIAALGAIGSPDGLAAILHGLTDRAPVRRRAVLALAPFDSPEVTEALTRATQDRDRQVRQAAEDLL